MTSESTSIIERAIGAAGGAKAIASLCGVSYQAVYKWQRKARLPRTEHTGETMYAAQIAEACRAIDPQSKITREALLGLPAVTRHDRRDRQEAGEAA